MTTIVTEARAVAYLQPNDQFVGFSGDIFTVTSIGVFTEPESVRVEFTHPSRPGEYATMTFSNPLQSMNVVKK